MERRRGVVVATTTTLAVFIGLAVALHCRRRRRRRRRREEKETLPPPAPAPAPVVRSTVYETVPTPALLRRHPTYGPFGDSDVTTFAGEPGGTFKIVYLVRHAQAEHNVQEKIAEEEVLAAGGTKEEAERARKAAIDQEHLRDAPLSVKGAAQVVDRAGVRLRLLHLPLSILLVTRQTIASLHRPSIYPNNSTYASLKSLAQQKRTLKKRSARRTTPCPRKC